MLLHEDRLFPAEPRQRKIAKTLYEHVRALPLVSPHGHTQAAWFARNEPFPDPAKLLVQPDHYIFRMLYSQGVSLEELEIGQMQLRDARKVWRIFAAITTCFAELRRACGWILPSRNSSGWRRGSRSTPPIFTSTRSPKNCKRRSFCRGLCTSVFIWRHWRQRILRSILWLITGLSGSRTGRRGFCLRFGPIRLLIQNLTDLPETLPNWVS